jgi:hypothetical protein
VVLRVLKGEPDAAELAALVTVLGAAGGSAAGSAAGAAAGAAAGSAARRRIGGWADRRAGLRSPATVGPGAWVASGRVRGVRTRAGP